MRAEIHTKAFSPGQGFIDTNAVTGIDSLWDSWHRHAGHVQCGSAAWIPLA